MFGIDRESFDIAVAAKEEVIIHLEEKVRWLEGQLEHQRQRADLAVDRLLSIQKIPTVMPENIVFASAKPEHVSEQLKVMEALKSEIETIGEISESEEPGVEREEIQ